MISLQIVLDVQKAFTVASLLQIHRFLMLKELLLCHMCMICIRNPRKIIKNMIDVHIGTGFFCGLIY